MPCTVASSVGGGGVKVLGYYELRGRCAHRAEKCEGVVRLRLLPGHVWWYLCAHFLCLVMLSVFSKSVQACLTCQQSQRHVQSSNLMLNFCLLRCSSGCGVQEGGGE